MAAPPPPPPQWVLDLNSTPPSKAKAASAMPDPPGFSSPLVISGNKTGGAKNNKNAPTPRKPPSAEEMDQLKLKKAWEVAIAPAKQLPMNAFGMYMTGNSLQIFSIFMVFTLFKGPVQALLNIQNQFQRFETDGTRQQMLVVKAAFVACNCLALALGIWKVDAMGLLP
ncbi:hypothetical protein MBLNU230_g3236t2 [Neophaeotheca triangularis]